jgi:hypothetical protein
MQDLPTIGRSVLIDIVDFGMLGIPAKVDTGADSSAIWVSYVRKRPAGLECIFFGTGSPYYTGEVVTITRNYSVARVVSSFGQKELRYKLKLRVHVQGRLIHATFTLSDRSSRTYPVLLGRRLLHKKFLVDVSQYEPTRATEIVKTKSPRKAEQ